MSQVVSAPPSSPAQPRPGARERSGRDLLGWTALGIGIAVHLLFLGSLRWGWLNPLFNDSMHRFGPGCDFFSIYAAGEKARRGASVYAVGDHAALAPYAYAFRYAPVVAYTLGAALSLLPAVSAYGLWLILCELALLQNIRLTLRLAAEGAAAPGRRLSPPAAAALWLLFTPYYLELYVGQFTFVTASLVFWAYLLWRPGGAGAPGAEREREREAGDGFWTAAALLKLMPLVYLPVLLLRGRWKAAALGLALLGVTSAAYFARFPGDWATFAATNGDLQPTWHAGNQGLMALLAALFGGRPESYALARGAALLAVGALLAGLAAQAFRRSRGGARRDGARAGAAAADEPALLLLYAGCTAAFLLLYKDVWEHHYVLLLPPLVLLALRRESPWLWLPPFLVGALPGLFALYDLPGLGYNEDPQHYWGPAVSLLHHGWKPLAPLWLTAGIGLRALAQTRLAARCRRLPLPARGRPALLLRTAAGLLAAAGTLGAAGWARSAIAAQRRDSRERVWPDAVFRRQQRPEDCGPAALAAVCRHFGIPATEGELARLSGTGPGGTSMLGLAEAARAKGLAASGARVAPTQLRALPRPSLLFIRQGSRPGHFVILTGMDGRRCYVADPSTGQRIWSEELLARLWDGEALLVGPQPH